MADAPRIESAENPELLNLKISQNLYEMDGGQSDGWRSVSWMAVSQMDGGQSDGWRSVRWMAVSQMDGGQSDGWRSVRWMANFQLICDQFQLE